MRLVYLPTWRITKHCDHHFQVFSLTSREGQYYETITALNKVGMVRHKQGRIQYQNLQYLWIEINLKGILGSQHHVVIISHNNETTPPEMWISTLLVTIERHSEPFKDTNRSPACRIADCNCYSTMQDLVNKANVKSKGKNANIRWSLIIFACACSPTPTSLA